MSNSFLINKSGVTVPVYAETDKNSDHIGDLYNREAFGYNRNWGGDGVACHICFLGPDGKLISGFILDPADSAVTPCTDYPYGTEKIEGETFYTFIARRKLSVYTAELTYWGAVAANRRVACRTAMAGDTYPYYKGINYVEKTDGTWVKVDGDGYEYGFVDTGLSIASGYSSIPLYGSW